MASIPLALRTERRYEMAVTIPSTLLLSARRSPPQQVLERWPCDVVRCGGRSELLRARCLDLQILSLLGERLEDKATLTLS